MISSIQKALEVYNSLQQSDAPNQSKEFEIRLGKFKNKQFIAGLPEVCFRKIKQLFSQDDWTEEIIDETIFYEIPEKQRKNYGWILKDKILQHDIQEENFRIAFNLENTYTFKEVLQRHNATSSIFTKENIQMFRKKQRFIKQFQHWEIHLTRVDVFEIENDDFKFKQKIYECEIELIPQIDIDIKETLESFQSLWNLISPIHYSSMIFPIYYYLVKSNKFIGNQPKTLEKENMHLLSNDYMVTDKADGKRMFLISTQKGVFLIDNLLNCFKYSTQGYIPYGTLLDGEYINGKFLAFDCLFFKNKDIRQLFLLERFSFLDNIEIDKKHFVDIKDSKTLWKQKDNFGYHLDGLIFTPKNQDYYGSILKWKHLHTIDVFVDNNFDICAWSSKDKKNILIKEFFQPTNIVKTINTQLVESNQIVELGYDLNQDIWYKKCVRIDKTKANAILTVQSVIKAITENISIDDILNFLQSNYQTIGKTLKERCEKIDIQYRKFHNIVKQKLLNFPKQGTYLLDLGCGKGGDIMKWIASGYTHVLAIDSSHTHLYGPNGFQERYEKVKHKINITFVWGDVSKPISDCGLNEDEQKKINLWLEKEIKFDVISCQFAIHYFMNDKKQWMNFMKNVSLLLKNHGYFIGTYLNAHNLQKLTTIHEFKIQNQTFYTLKHQNPIFKELNAKKMIHQFIDFWKHKEKHKDIYKILVQTSEWDTEIEENIIFPEHFEILVAKYKFKTIKNESFTKFRKEFNGALSNDEELLSSLHNFFIIQLEKKY